MRRNAKGSTSWLRRTRTSSINSNLTARRIGIVVLLSTSWPRIQRVIPSIVAAIEASVPGSYTEVKIPYGDG